MTPKKPIRAERRHSIRINGSFFVEIVGVDEQPGVRRGNISVSGIYFEYDRDIGPPGSVCRLRVASSESGESMDVLTRVVRVVSYTDLWKGTIVAGIALEFMLQNSQQQDEVSRLIREAAELQIQRARGLQVDHRLDAAVASQDHKKQQATLRNLNLDGMTLETDWPVRVGEKIHLVIEAPESERKIQLNGRVTRSNNLSGEGAVRFAHQVDFSESLEQPADPVSSSSNGPRGFSIADAVDGLLAEIITAHPETPRVDPRLPFCGRLSQVTLQGLLGFFEIESVSGTLKLEQKEFQAVLFLQKGRVIDIESNTQALDPRKVLAELLTWEDALFEFNSLAVEREDRIGLPTARLLASLDAPVPNPTSE